MDKIKKNINIDENLPVNEKVIIDEKNNNDVVTIEDLEKINALLKEKDIKFIFSNTDTTDQNKKTKKKEENLNEDLKSQINNLFNNKNIKHYTDNESISKLDKELMSFYHHCLYQEKTSKRAMVYENYLSNSNFIFKNLTNKELKKEVLLNYLFVANEACRYIHVNYYTNIYFKNVVINSIDVKKLINNISYVNDIILDKNNKELLEEIKGSLNMKYFQYYYLYLINNENIKNLNYITDNLLSIENKNSKSLEILFYNENIVNKDNLKNIFVLKTIDFRDMSKYARYKYFLNNASTKEAIDAISENKNFEINLEFIEDVLKNKELTINIKNYFLNKLVDRDNFLNILNIYSIKKILNKNDLTEDKQKYYELHNQFLYALNNSFNEIDYSLFNNEENIILFFSLLKINEYQNIEKSKQKNILDLYSFYKFGLKYFEEKNDTISRNIFEKNIINNIKNDPNKYYLSNILKLNITDKKDFINFAEKINLKINYEILFKEINKKLIKIFNLEIQDIFLNNNLHTNINYKKSNILLILHYANINIKDHLTNFNNNFINSLSLVNYIEFNEMLNIKNENISKEEEIFIEKIIKRDAKNGNIFKELNSIYNINIDLDLLLENKIFLTYLQKIKDFLNENEVLMKYEDLPYSFLKKCSLNEKTTYFVKLFNEVILNDALSEINDEKNFYYKSKETKNNEININENKVENLNKNIKTNKFKTLIKKLNIFKRQEILNNTEQVNSIEKIVKQSNIKPLEENVIPVSSEYSDVYKYIILSPNKKAMFTNNKNYNFFKKNNSLLDETIGFIKTNKIILDIPTQELLDNLISSLKIDQEKNEDYKNIINDYKYEQLFNNVPLYLQEAYSVTLKRMNGLNILNLTDLEEKNNKEEIIQAFNDSLSKVINYYVKIKEEINYELNIEAKKEQAILNKIIQNEEKELKENLNINNTENNKSTKKMYINR